MFKILIAGSMVRLKARQDKGMD